MPKPQLLDLSRRERQVLDIVYRLNAATAGEVQRELADEPGYSAVRGILSTLEKKGHLRVERDGLRYVYHPTLARDAAQKKMLGHVIETFFGGSLTQAVSAMLDERNGRISKQEKQELQRMLRKAREEGR
jgi:predicted transcriptional regulator